MQASCQITDVMKEDGEPDLTTLAGRVKWARKQRKLSQEAVAGKAHVSQGTIGNIESGERKRPRELLAIARALYANPEWLETGRGEWDMAKARGAEPVHQKGAIYHAPDAEERQMLDVWRRMSASDREAMLMQMAEKAERYQSDVQRTLDEAGVKLPFPLTSPVSAAAVRERHAARTASKVTKQRELPLETAGGRRK